MRRLSVLSAALILLASGCDGATSPDTLVAVSDGPPPGWLGGGPSSYTIGTTADSHTGDRAVFLAGGINATGLASILQAVSVEAHRGKRVRWSAWIKTRDLNPTFAGIWIRVDGPRGSLTFDNMFWAQSELTGTHDWRQMSVVIDVPEAGLGIALGALLNGTGVLIIDDMKLEQVPTTVALTNPAFVPTSISGDSASIAASYATAGAVPLNLDFEAGGEPGSQSVDWLKSHVTVLTSALPTAPAAELDAMTAMVGDARIVGLGEGTHGTSEFFSMKDRMVRHLVTKMGFTRFAIEATSPEADEVNRYVLGESTASPATLIHNLYFWTWDVQEVLSLVEWMRGYNATVPVAQRVQFLGFDMQYPGGAIDSVEAFIASVDAAQTAYVSDRIDCIRPYRNVGFRFDTPRATYAAKTEAEKQACAASLSEVHQLIASSTAYRSAEPARYEAALHSARLIQQFEKMAAPRSVATSSFYRDEAMAENVRWIHDQSGGNAKIALWAHNGHVVHSASRMGGMLRKTYGNAYLNVGFTFGKGSFKAVGGGQNTLQSWSDNVVRAGALEDFFSRTGYAVALFDARQIPTGGAAAAQLAQPMHMRSIGALWNPASANAFYSVVLLPRDYDLILWVAEAKASVSLR